MWVSKAWTYSVQPSPVILLAFCSWVSLCLDIVLFSPLSHIFLLQSSKYNNIISVHHPWLCVAESVHKASRRHLVLLSSVRLWWHSPSLSFNSSSSAHCPSDTTDPVCEFTRQIFVFAVSACCLWHDIECRGAISRRNRHDLWDKGRRRSWWLTVGRYAHLHQEAHFAGININYVPSLARL